MKSHTGIKGNELADKFAKLSTGVWMVDMSTELTEPILRHVLDQKLVLNNEGAEDGNQFLRNLQDSAKAAVHARHRLRQANQDTTKVQAWRKVEEFVMKDVSYGFWEDQHRVNDAMLRNILKSRYSQLWHMGKAHMFRVPYFPGGPIATSNACPLCGQPDSGSHMLGGCLHPRDETDDDLRHEAHRMMLKGISKGKHGSSLIIADVGRIDKLSTIGVHDKRISNWVLPDSLPQSSMT